MSVLSRHIEMFEEYLFTKKVAIVVGSTVAAYYSAKLFFRYRYRQKVKSHPKDVVVLYQLQKGYRVPSPSPYVLKLQTWLRMNDIKYQNEFGLFNFMYGPKGKIPFIVYDGNEIGDSQFIIEYLSKKMNKGLNSGLVPKDLGTARSFFKMIEESTFWASTIIRVLFEPDQEYLGIGPIVLWIAQRAYRERAHIQGYGRHTKEEIIHIAKDDLKALEDFLEGKKYLCGDKPCNEDSAIFGLIALLVYADRGTFNKFIMSECPRIVSYIENIKNTYWPDWDKCITMTNKAK